MSQRSVQFHEFACDNPKCTTKVIAVALPADWSKESKEVGPCGLTDYYRTETYHFCPRCTADKAKDIPR